MTFKNAYKTNIMLHRLACGVRKILFFSQRFFSKRWRLAWVERGEEIKKIEAAEPFFGRKTDSVSNFKSFENEIEYQLKKEGYSRYYKESENTIGLTELLIRTSTLNISL